MARTARIEPLLLKPLNVEPPVALAPVLVVGRGMLGRAFEQDLSGGPEPVDVFDLDRLDIRDSAQVARAIQPGRRLVINCAGWTDVDGAEANEQAAFALNAGAVARLAAECREAGATLVHFSTDYVFDGKATSPYLTDLPRSPVNAYGRSKAAGEAALEASGCDYLLIRTSWMYAPWGKNFVRTIAAAAACRPVLRVVDDQRGRPTSAEHLATVTRRLLAAGARGTWHATDGGECSWHEFAAEIALQVGAGATVEACPSSELSRPAQRPSYSTLDLEATESLLGAMPSWRRNLRSVLDRIER
jgi:dTDP-4-dehydrorhamnose reductase